MPVRNIFFQFLSAFAVAREWEGVCPSLGPGLGTSRGAGSTFPGIGTPWTADALSSGLRPLGEVDASAPPSPRAPVLPSGGRNVPLVCLPVLYSSASLPFRDPREIRFRASRPNRLSRSVEPKLSPIPRAWAWGRSPSPPARACTTLLALAPLSRPPGLREAPVLPFRTRHPPNLGWTLLRRALPPTSPRPLQSCNLEAQLSTSGDFSLLSSPWAKFPNRSRGLRAFTSARASARGESAQRQ